LVTRLFRFGAFGFFLLCGLIVAVPFAYFIVSDGFGPPPGSSWTRCSGSTCTISARLDTYDTEVFRTIDLAVHRITDTTADVTVVNPDVGAETRTVTVGETVTVSGLTVTLTAAAGRPDTHADLTVTR